MDKIFQTIESDMRQAEIERCPDCGGVIVADATFEPSEGERPFSYKIWRFCFDCGYLEEC